MERDVNGDTAVEDDRCGVLIEEGLDADDLVAWVQVSKQSCVHS